MAKLEYKINTIKYFVNQLRCLEYSKRNWKKILFTDKNKYYNISPNNDSSKGIGIYKLEPTAKCSCDATKLETILLKVHDGLL